MDAVVDGSNDAVSKILRTKEKMVVIPPQSPVMKQLGQGSLQKALLQAMEDEKKKIYFCQRPPSQ